VWLAVSTGLAWSIFGPGLILITRKTPFVCAHACLITMSYGEGVLAAGAVINLAMRLTGAWHFLDPALFNLAWVALSNIVMAAILSQQFQAVGVPSWKIILAWNGLLNGAGAVFAFVFRSLLGGRPG
jgi:hypothetical protein